MFPSPAVNCCTQGGVGSDVSVVAPELCFVSVKELLVMAIALAKLSLAGGAATTVNVGNGVVPLPVGGGENVVPPPGGGVRTPTEFVLPKLARTLPGMVAERCWESVNVVGIRVLPLGRPLADTKSGLSMTCELVEKSVPVTVMTWPFVLTLAFVGLTPEIVGGPERMPNVR